MVEHALNNMNQLLSLLRGKLLLKGVCILRGYFYWNEKMRRFPFLRFLCVTYIPLKKISLDVKFTSKKRFSIACVFTIFKRFIKVDLDLK